MINVAFLRDEIVSPMSSMIFGVEFDRKEKTFTPFEGRIPGLDNHTDLGLQKLYDRGRMWNCVTDSTHTIFVNMATKEYTATMTRECHYSAKRTDKGEVLAEPETILDASELEKINKVCDQELEEQLNNLYAIDLICDRGKKNSSGNHDWAVPDEDYYAWVKDINL